jgi:hypothetical protein
MGGHKIVLLEVPLFFRLRDRRCRFSPDFSFPPGQ